MKKMIRMASSTLEIGNRSIYKFSYFQKAYSKFNISLIYYSGILLPALRFSRENNLKASFVKYSVQNKIFFRPDLPENSLPIPYTGLLGTCTLSIGPFLYLDTQVYELLFVSQQILLDEQN